MNDVIQKLIESGVTPDEIFAEAKQAKKEYESRKAAEDKRQGEIAKARDNTVTAIVNYMYALTGTHLQAAEVKDLEEDFKRVEELVTGTKEKDTKKKDSKRTREERERDVRDILSWLWTLS